MRQLEQELDECFGTLRRRMEVDQQYSQGTRAYIRVLRLLERHSLADLTRAVQRALELGLEHEEAIEHLLLCPAEQRPLPLDLSGRAHLAAYRVVPPDVAAYGALAGRGNGLQSGCDRGGAQ